MTFYQTMIKHIANDILSSAESKEELEGAWEVYMDSLKSEVWDRVQVDGERLFKLKSETNTPEMKKKIERLAKTVLKGQYSDPPQVVWNRDHWWVRYHGAGENDTTLAVVDADPGLRGTGLDFEDNVE